MSPAIRLDMKKTKSLEPKPVRLWPPALVAGIAFLGGVLELVWPDGVYAEVRPIRLQIEALGLPAFITTSATVLTRVGVGLAYVIALTSVGTAAGALLLGALNERRMRHSHKFVIYLLCAVVITLVPRAKLFGEGIYFGYLIVAVTHLGLGVALLVLQRTDIARFRATYPPGIRPANVVLGLLIALAGVVIQSALSIAGFEAVLQTNLFTGGNIVR